jgi:hypothetical protein
MGSLVERVPLPPCPEEFYVLATDGSHIDVDRHRTASCYLINIGTVALRYGKNPGASLSSSPRLYSGKEELALSLPLMGNRVEPLQGALLGMKRGVEECRGLVSLAGENKEKVPTLALLDGSLIMWGLAGGTYSEFVLQELLEKGLLTYMDELRELAGERPLALASYISFPGSTEVVNILRLVLCPHEPADCDRFCSGEQKQNERACLKVAGLQDRELFDILNPGERSAVYLSRSSIVQKYYGRHEVCFFYLKGEDEIARVEIPRWVVEMGLTELVHALVYDQCRRGRGYPVALSESHEKAVVTGADREHFWEVVEEALVGKGLPARGSSKSISKRTRWI